MISVEMFTQGSEPIDCPDGTRFEKQWQNLEMHAEIRELRKMMKITLFKRNRSPRRGVIIAIEYERISNILEKIQATKRFPIFKRMKQPHILLRETEEMAMHCKDESDHMHFRHLMERVH